MTNYEETKVRPTNNQLKKNNSAWERKAGTALKITREKCLRRRIPTLIILNHKTKNQNKKCFC